jgi:hypothetical protein
MNLFGFCCLITIVGLTIIGCNEGISPVEEKAITEAHGIKGTIYFSNWPPTDSIVDLRLVAFLNYPPQDIYSEVIQGMAKYTDRLPAAVDSFSYTLILNPLPADSIRCIAIGMQFGPNIQTDWRLVGLYYNPVDSSLPGRIYVPTDSLVPNINISVDFNKLPPQP